MSGMHRWSWHNRLGAVALGVSCGLALWTLHAPPRAVPAGSVAAGGAPERSGAGVEVPEITLRSDAGRFHLLVLRAVERDPFRAERSRPRGRYRLPGEEPAPPAPASPDVPPPPPPSAPAAPPSPPPRVRGIAATGAGGGLVAVEVAGGARVVRVGEEVAGYRLLSVTPSEARFRVRDSVAVVRLAPPAP